MFKDNIVSLIIPAYNEEASIGKVVDDYKKCEYIDEILVVDNNSSDRTSEIAKEHGAKVVLGIKQGYGNALKYGMDNARGDILLLTEADGSFKASDAIKLLVYLEDAEMVVGTRTVKNMNMQGSRMNSIIRIADILVAKLLEMLWIFSNETRLTDVGCTYRVLWKSTYQKIRARLFGSGPEFSPEMIAEAIKCKMKVIEVPVKYCAREGGNSKHSSNYFKLYNTALRMLKIIIRERFLTKRL